VRLTPQFLRALHGRGAKLRAPTIETIVPGTFYEIINLKEQSVAHCGKSRGSSMTEKEKIRLTAMVKAAG